MSKNVVQASGNQLSSVNQPIQVLTNGFSVRVDPLQTPQDLGDDLVYSYTLSGNRLSVACAQADPAHAAPAACPTGANTALSNHINPGFSNSVMPENALPTSGFYVNLTANGTTVEVGLVAKFRPSASSADISTDNPQIQMKNQMQSRNVSSR
jgi:hypothetical protein